MASFAQAVYLIRVRAHGPYMAVYTGRTHLYTAVYDGS